MHTSIKDPTLVKWIHGTAMHEQLAFEKLYKATSPYVFSILRRMLYSDSHAEETLQFVFIDVWKKSKTYKSSEIAPKTWIYNIARRHAIMELRKRETSKKTQTPADRPAALNRSNLTGIEAQLKEPGKGFERLDQTAWKFISLAYRDGFSYEELSQETQQPVNIIKSRIRTSLLTLKELQHEH